MSVNSLFLSVHNIDAFACNAVQFASVETVYSFAAVDVCGYGVDVCGLTLKRYAYRLCVYVCSHRLLHSCLLSESQQLGATADDVARSAYYHYSNTVCGVVCHELIALYLQLYIVSLSFFIVTYLIISRYTKIQT